ncbi:TPA: McrC family protein [Stenotrophomonas maltophilia]
MIDGVQLVENGTWTPLSKVLPNSDPERAYRGMRLLGIRLKDNLKLRNTPFEFRTAASGEMDVRVSGIAGSVNVMGKSIDVVPKFVFGDHSISNWQASMVLLMQHASLKHVHLSRTNLLLAGKERFVDLIALAFLDSVRLSLATQLIQLYRTEAVSRPALSGRLNVIRQARSFWARPHLIECDVDRLVPENRFNSLLKWACLALSRSVARPDLRSSLMDCYHRFPGRPMVLSRGQSIVGALPPQYHSWHNSLVLAELVCAGLSLSSSKGNNSGFSFAFNMERVFERFVELRLQSIVSSLGSAYRVKPQVSTLYAFPVDGEGRGFFSKPDNVLYDGDVPIMVIDAKYKRLSDSQGSSNRQPVSSDVYEAVAAMTAQKCGFGLLVYPRIAGDTLLRDGSLRSWKIVTESRHLIVGAVGIDIASIAKPGGLNSLDRDLVDSVNQLLVQY